MYIYIYTIYIYTILYIYIHSVIYIYHNPGKAVSTAEACLSRSVKYSGRMETPELCPAFRARALRGERKFQTLWLSILGKRVSFKGPWAKKSGIGFNFKLNTIHRTLLPLYKHPLYDKSLCIGMIRNMYIYNIESPPNIMEEIQKIEKLFSPKSGPRALKRPRSSVLM